MKTRNYILDETGTPRPEPNLIKWAQWMEQNGPRRKVRRETIGDADVSTVFLGTDHNFGFRGGPTLWETMVFGGKLDEDCVRCGGTIEQAEAMHAEMVSKVREVEGVDAA